MYRDREWLGSCGAETLAEIRKITGGGADFALEESAEPAVFRLAVDVLRGLGTCILVGNARAGTEVSFAAGRPDCARRRELRRACLIAAAPTAAGLSLGTAVPLSLPGGASQPPLRRHQGNRHGHRLSLKNIWSQDKQRARGR